MFHVQGKTAPKLYVVDPFCVSRAVPTSNPRSKPTASSDAFRRFHDFVKIVLNTKAQILTQEQIQTLPTHTAQMRFELFPITKALIRTQAQINPHSTHTSPNRVKIVFITQAQINTLNLLLFILLSKLSMATSEKNKLKTFQRMTHCSRR